MKDGEEDWEVLEKGKPDLLPETTFPRMPSQGYWYALMKYYDDGSRKIPYDKEYSEEHFAIIAFPFEYKESGWNTYIINEEGKIYRKDLEGSGYLDTYPGPDPLLQGWEIVE